MGGCRCSYRTCTVKSNTHSPIHMFHYPVFDKPRCHQWISNAQKLNFLDLKLSQLRNRVICEHHFKDSDFMNFTKGKLKKDAIPTLDGPYCEQQHNNDESEMFPINLEDIENDHLTNIDKRAHFAVKYGDFLTNDITDLSSLTTTQKPSININVMDSARSYDQGYKISNRIYDDLSYKNTLHSDPVPTLFQNNFPNAKLVAIEYEELNPNSKDVKNTQTLQPNIDQGTFAKPRHQIKNCNNNIIQNYQQHNVVPNHQFKETSAANNKIKILSEKKISQPVTLKGELQTVSPSTILKVPNKRNNQHVNGTQIETYSVNLKNEPITSNTQVFDENFPLLQCNIRETLNECPPATIHNMPAIVEHVNENGQNEKMVYQQDSGMSMKLEQNLTNLNQFSISDTIVPTSTSGSLDIVSIDMPDISMLRTDEQPMLSVTTDMINVPVTPTEAVNICDGPLTRKDGNMLNIEASEIFTDKRRSSRLTKCKPNTSPTKTKPYLSSSPSAGNSQKSKMPPEKLALIEEKRKYNIKLRDIINSCLNKLDEEPNTCNIPPVTKTSKNMIDTKVGEHLSSDLSLPTSQENIISYLEARLQKTEHILLNKIEQNTNKIAELKKFIKPSSGKKSVFTQTYANLNTKRHLYSQISQYLTPEINSMIYEELFINKYSQKLLNNQPSTKRRKRT